MRLPLLLGLGLTSTALAVAPSDHVHQGIEPQRVFTYDPGTQIDHLRSPAWQEFTAAEGAGWLARFDEKTGTPHRMWGGGIPIRTDSGDTVEADLIAFVERNADLLGVNPSSVQTKTVSYNERLDTWYVDMDVVERGAPIYLGGLTFRVKNGNLVLAGADTYPSARVPRTGRANLGGYEAAAIAVEQGPHPSADHAELDAELVWLPQELDGEVELRLVYKTFSRTTTLPGQWVGFVDARTGELISVHNEVRFGAISGVVDDRYPAGDFVTVPMRWIDVDASDGSSVTADWDGVYSHGSAGPYTVPLEGDYVRVSNRAGDDGQITVDTDGTFTDADAHQAEIDVYYWLHDVHAWAGEHAPDVGGMVGGSVRAYVNESGSCNAYYDGNVNFLQAGDGCNNTGRLADVVYHEWGHGFHQYSMQAGTWDGVIGEGAGDVVSILQTGDSRMAPYFGTNGYWIRNADNDKVYPDDVVNQVHADGEIFSASFWDLWHLLEDTYDADTAYSVTSSIFAGTLVGGPTLETAYDEAVVADDDDGDLSNGTPHVCELLEAFGRHGLAGASGAAAGLLADHEPLALSTAGVDHEIAVDIVNLAPDCIDVGNSGSVTYRVDGGSWSTVDLSVTADGAVGAIPAQEFGSFVEYYIEVEDSNGSTISAPVGGFTSPYSFYVGDVLEVQCWDFESDDGGFTHELLAGEEREGADDWQWGQPNGRGGDPDQAASGSFVWGNDLGEGEYNGQYQPGKHNRLTSPAVDTLHYQDNLVHYKRWLGVEDGRWDKANILADEEIVWSNHDSGSDQAGEHHQENEWVSHSVDLAGMGDDSSVQLAWEIISDGEDDGRSYVELSGWTLDDVCVYAPATADNRLGITDFLASDGEEGGVTLTWTNPRHAPVEKVVVVRGDSAYPETPDAGVVVFEDDAPEVLAQMSATDTAVDDDIQYHYAVFAYDGEEWLSWTIEGWNADVGSAFGAEGEDSLELGKGGCGCSTTPTAGAGWLGLALLGLVGLRRRRD